MIRQINSVLDTVPWLMLFHMDDDIAARLVSIMDDFSVNAAARMLPSSVIRQHPSTPSFRTDFSTSGSLLAANITAAVAGEIEIFLLQVEKSVGG